MKLILVLVLLLLLGFTCQKNDYVNKHKWQILGEHKRSDFIKGKPVFVKEILQFTIENDVRSKLLVQNSYDEYHFSSAGDITHKRTFITDDFFSNTNFSYDNNGMSYFLILTSGDKEKPKYDTLISTSRLLSNGKFKRINHRKEEITAILESYLNGGGLLVEEYLKDTTDNSDVLLTSRKYYSSDKLTKAELLHKDGSISTEQYYYSDKGLLDSVVRVTERWGLKNRDKRVYQYNEQGDYNFFAEISGVGDTTALATVKYVYDNKGNWIRKLVDEEGWYDGKPVVNKMLEKKYCLLSREIKYQ